MVLFLFFLLGVLCLTATSGTPIQLRSVKGKPTKEREERMRRETRNEESTIWHERERWEKGIRKQKENDRGREETYYYQM